jgi:pimeloyl-ACP methyl ester carboxylesterase
MPASSVCRRSRSSPAARVPACPARCSTGARSGSRRSPTIPLLFGVYPGLTGGRIGYADGDVADDTKTVYQLDGDPAVSPAEQALNESVIRVAATNTQTTNAHRTELPDIAGNPKIPVLSMHDLGDLFVPFSMDQIYAEQVAANGKDLFVDRAIRGTGHCEFSDEELSTGFGDLVTWAHTGAKPAGDAILDPQAVADPSFGCRFTDPAFEHLWFGGSCPATKP